VSKVTDLIKQCGMQVPGVKLLSELSYWHKCYKAEGNRLNNDFYAKLMLSIADEENDLFLQDKVVADFGCGPRGSLVWAESAQLRIGIDVLTNRYLHSFPGELSRHGMLYVTCSESHIPIPNEFCDVVYSVNSLDHVQNLLPICNELRRILKPGGILIGSFNLNHEPQLAEPQKISENTLRKMLFRDYDIQHWWLSAPGAAANRYQPLYTRELINPGKSEAYLWARVIKPLQ